MTRQKPHASFGITDFLLRWAASLVLVMITYNPSGYSYVHWAWSAVGEEGLGAIHLFTGALLVAGWAVFMVATSRSLGTVGAILGALVIGSAVWLLADIGLVRADSTSAVLWLALFSLATLLALGLSWSHVWRRLSGQLEVDDDD
jgi:hypothetical protein